MSWILEYVRVVTRAVFYDLSGRMATRSEAEKLKSKGITCRGTHNLLAWRRSVLGLAIIGMMVVSWFQYEDTFVALDHYNTTVTKMNQDIVYDAARDASSFRAYGQRVAEASGAAAMVDIMWIRVQCSRVLVGVNLFAIVVLLLALYFWDVYHRSRKLMLTSWLLAFAAPFAISTTPTRYFVRWDNFGNQTDIFINGAAEHYKVDEREAQVVASCGAITDPSNPQTLEEMRYNVDRMCGYLKDVDGGIMNWLSGDRISQARRNCEIAQEAVEDGRIDDALEITTETCDDILSEVEAAEGDNMDSLQRLQMILLSQDMATKARVAAELLISLANALWAVKGMVPAAVAIAPALLRGSLTVKQLIPQSTIPGMFVILLPWLYCPLVWCLYNILFQLTGTLALFFGLLLLAFGPMNYSLLGTYFHITKPMDDKTVIGNVRKMNVSSALLVVFALFLCGFFTFGQEGNHRALTKKGIDELLTPSATTHLVFSTFAKYLVTTIAGVDFVVGEITSQRDFEVFLTTGNDRGGHRVSALTRSKINFLMKERNERLDDLCKANDNKVNIKGMDRWGVEMGINRVGDRMKAVNTRALKINGKPPPKPPRTTLPPQFPKMGGGNKRKSYV